MGFRRRKASNRHWIFIKQEILAPLNDALALRHGAEYAFEVPENSFDWDVEFSVIKDRSGNTLREQYSSAWLQPSLVGPNDTVNQLGVKINWNNPELSKKKDFDPIEISKLMSKADEVLGSPLETKEDKEEKQEAPEEKPSSVTNQETTTASNNQIVQMLMLNSRSNRIAVELAKEEIAAQKAVSIINQVNDAKQLNDLDMQQIEIQKAYDEIEAMRFKPETLILGSMVKSICDKVRSSSIVDVEIYDMLSRVGRTISDSYMLSTRSSDYKLQAINEIETKMMDLFNDEDLNESITKLLKNHPISSIQSIFKTSSAQIDALRSKSLNLNIVETPAPQVIDDYVEEITKDPSFE